MSSSPTQDFILSNPYVKQNAGNLLSSNSNKKKISRIKFNRDEDEELLHLVSILGVNNWDKISKEMLKSCPRTNNQGQPVARTARQCKDRYLNYLSPELSHAEWTPEEDHLLELQALIKLRSWKEMKTLFPGRAEVELRNRFNYIHKCHFETIKPEIEYQIKHDSIYQQYTPNEIVQQAFNLRKSSIELDLSKNNEQSKKNTSNVFNGDIDLTVFEKLYKKYNKIPSGNIMSFCPSSSTSIDTSKLILTAVKGDAMRNKIEYIRQEVSSLSKVVENRVFFEMMNRVPNMTYDFSSDYDQFMNL